MKKTMISALLGLLFILVVNTSYAQDDSTEVAIDVPTDTISIDNMEPIYYEDDTKESSNGTTYAVIGGIVLIGGAAFYFMRKKK